MSKLKVFNETGFLADVIEASKRGPVLVDVWAPWCGPCRMVLPTMERIAEVLDGKASVGKLNADENPDVLAQYGIRSIPTVLVFRNGAVVDSLVGVRSEQDYLDAFASAQAA